MKKFLTLFFIVATYLLSAQNPIQKIFSTSPPNSYLWAMDGHACNDGGYLLSCNETDSNGIYSTFIIKMNSAFGMQWCKNLSDNQFGSIFINEIGDRSGGYYIAGFYYDYFGVNSGLYSAQLDLNGSVLWFKVLPISGQVSVSRVRADISGNLFFGISGVDFNSSNSFVGMVKVDVSGNLIWSRKVESVTNKNPAFDFAFTSDGGTLVTGKLDNNVFLVKFSASGLVDWANSYDAGPNSYIQARTICALPDGSFFLGGFKGTSQMEGLLLKVSATGAIIWSKSPNLPFMIELSTLMTDGTIILQGIENFSGDRTFIKVNQDGDVLSAYDYAPVGNVYGFGISGFEQDINGDYFTFGTLNDYVSTSDAFILQRSSGTVLPWCDLFPVSVANSSFSYQPQLNPVTVNSIITFNPVNIPIASTNRSVIVTDYCSNTGIPETPNFQLSLSPNPATTHLNIDLGDNFEEVMTYQIIDVLGKVHASGILSQPTSILDLQLLSPSLYFLEIKTMDKSMSQKFIKQ